MFVGARPWQILENASPPERYPEEFPPPLEVRIRATPAFTYQVEIESPVVPDDPPPRRPKWSVAGAHFRSIGAAIAVDMASPLLGHLPQLQSTVEELVNIILEMPPHFQIEEHSPEGRRMLSIYVGIYSGFNRHQLVAVGDDPAIPTLLAANFLAWAARFRNRKTRRTRMAVTWALKALAHMGTRDQAWPLEEAQQRAEVLQYWLDLWWSETLEVLAWDRSKLPLSER